MLYFQPASLEVVHCRAWAPSVLDTEILAVEFPALLSGKWWVFLAAGAVSPVLLVCLA